MKTIKKKNRSEKKHTSRKSIDKISLFINTLTDTERKMLFLFMSFNLPKENWYLPLVKTIPIKELQELDPEYGKDVTTLDNFDFNHDTLNIYLRGGHGVDIVTKHHPLTPILSWFDYLNTVHKRKKKSWLWVFKNYPSEAKIIANEKIDKFISGQEIILNSRAKILFRLISRAPQLSSSKELYYINRFSPKLLEQYKIGDNVPFLEYGFNIAQKKITQCLGDLRTGMKKFADSNTIPVIFKFIIGEGIQGVEFNQKIFKKYNLKPNKNPYVDHLHYPIDSVILLPGYQYEIIENKILKFDKDNIMFIFVKVSKKKKIN